MSLLHIHVHIHCPIHVKAAHTNFQINFQLISIIFLLREIIQCGALHNNHLYCLFQVSGLSEEFSQLREFFRLHIPDFCLKNTVSTEKKQ